MDECTLVSLLNSGDPAAIERLYLAIKDPLAVFVRTRLPCALLAECDPEDIVHDVFLRFQRYHAERPRKFATVTEVWSLVTTIASNAMRSAYRHVKCVPMESLAVAQNTTEPADMLHDPLDEAAANDALAAALAPLSDAEREIVKLRTEDYTVEELSYMTGKSQRSVQRILGNARDAIRRAVGRSSSP